MLKVGNENTGLRCLMCLMLTIKTSEQRRYTSTVNFENI